MPVSSLTPFADNVLSSLVSSALQTSPARDAFQSLFLPPQLTHAAARLSTDALVGLLSTARQSLLSLSTSAARLDLADPTSALFTATVTSSASAVDGTIVAGISRDTTPEKTSYAFTVSQLARAQANTGTALDADETNGFTVGTNSVRFTQNGTTTDVDFTVAAGETNVEVLGNFAAAVNAKSGLGVSASVDEDPVAGTARLVLVSETTGTTNAFTVADLAGAPVTDAGVGSATTSAQNAAYTLDGTAYTRETNDFYLGTYANLHVELRATTSDTVTLTVDTDTTQVASAVTTLVADFNAANGFFDQWADVYPSAAAHLGQLGFRLQGQLATIGITLGASGSLSVDTAKLDDALGRSFDRVQSILGDAGGFAKELRLLADRELATPAAHAASQPPFQAGYAPHVFAGDYAARLQDLHLTGLLVNALI
jgi:flagellar hook-associated protein 2